jgi:Cu+-exporting ATPase
MACSTNDKKSETKTIGKVEIVEATIDIGGLHCNNCVASVEKGLKALDGIEKVEVTLEDSTAVVKYNASAVDIEKIKKSIEKRGYSIKGVK